MVTAHFPIKWRPSPPRLPYGESNEEPRTIAPFLRLSLQTAAGLTFVNTVNTADVRITRVSERYEAQRLNINTSGGGCLSKIRKGSFVKYRAEKIRVEEEEEEI